MKLFFKILSKDFYHLLRDAGHREFLRLAFRYGDTPRYQARKVRFLRYQVQVPDTLSFIWQFREIFAEESYFFGVNNPAPVILDCGANIGLSCLFFKHHYPLAKIIAFEADPNVAALLTENLRQNGFSDISVIAKAVWTQNATIPFAGEGADGGSAVAGKASMQVPAVRLKDYLHGAGRIDLLKMDIEGAEVAVLEDCRGSLGEVQQLFVEYHAYTMQAQRLDTLLTVLQESGFRYFIRSEADRPRPFVNRFNRSTPYMDLQLNIFAYR